MSTVFKPLPNDFLDQLVKESLKLPARVWKEVLAGHAYLRGCEPEEY